MKALTAVLIILATVVCAGIVIARAPATADAAETLSGAEALAHGIPVVAFDVGGVREWLADSVSGFIVPEKDTAAMAEKLDLLYLDKTLAEKLGQAGRESVRSRFSPEQFTAALRKLLDSVTR